MSAAPASGLLAGLATAIEALEAGRLDAAAEILDGLARTWAAPGGSLRPLEGGELERAQALYVRCQQVAEGKWAELVASLLQSATMRRASHAYQPKT